MKNKFLQLSMVALTAGSLLVASCSKEESKTETPTPQETFLASTSNKNRTALLEDFTGVRCGFCPDGHVRAKAAQDLLGKDKFIIMAVHGGSYAAPSSGWANFTTNFGAALISQAKVTGYPAGTINRKVAADMGVAPQSPGGMAMSRAAWAASAEFVNNMFAPINVGAKATFNTETRELTVKVDMYLSATLTTPINLNIALLQSGLLAKQSGDPTPNDPYSQDHVLRHLITGQWGDVITEATTEKAKITKTYKYIVPANYNGITADGGGAVVIANCTVVAFVNSGRADILNAVEVAIK
jgi:hypothetical protein